MMKCGWVWLFIEASANTAQSRRIVEMDAKHSFTPISPCFGDSACKKHHTVMFFAALPNELRSSDS